MKSWKDYEGANWQIKRKGKTKKCENIVTLATYTSSYVDEKVGVCYAWTVGIDGNVYIGRNLQELPSMLDAVRNDNGGAKITIWCSDLGDTIEYLRNVCDIHGVIARDMYKPMSAYVGKDKLRDVSILCNMDIDKAAKHYGIAHISHGLDDMRRTPNTPLSDDEIETMEQDALMLYDYVEMKRKEYGSVDKIPMTQTSEVRKMLIDTIKTDGGVDVDSTKAQWHIKDWYKRNAKTYDDYDVYEKLCMAYRGGSVVANKYTRGEIIEGVDSYDLTSDYIYQMLVRKYPISKFERCKTDVRSENYIYMYKVRLGNVRSKLPVSMLSSAKCRYDAMQCMMDNGHIDRCAWLETWLTDVDLQIVKMSYDCDVEILEAYRSVAGKLPRQIINLLSTLYTAKQTIKQQLRDDASLAGMYRQTKERLNGVYGMCVTKYVSDYVTMENGWEKREATREECKQQWDDMRDKTLLPYRWGVWIAAYARLTLWSAIAECGDTVMYCDTDSVKVDEDISGYIEQANEQIRAEVIASCNHYGLPAGTFAGLGEWDHDGHYDRFVSLGAKKYAVEVNGNVKITLAGVDKDLGSASIDNVEKFADGLIFSPDECGKTARYHVTQASDMDVTDYMGNNYTVKAGSSVCVVPQSYELHDAPAMRNAQVVGGARYLARLVL